MRRRIALGLVAIAAAVTPIAAAGGSGTVRHRDAAHSAARQMLAKLILPAGAARASSDPSRAGLLRRAPESPATAALVDLHSFWRIPGTPASVLDWIRAHPPAGSTRGTSGGLETRTGARATWDGYEFGAVSGVLSSRTLLVEVARALGGGTALRADAQAVWVLPKSPTERIPRRVRAVSITSRRPGMPASAPHTVTSPDKVRRIVAFLDGLPVAQPGVRGCPADMGPLVQLDFRPTIHGSPIAIAVADGSGCGLVTLRVRGHTEPALSGGPRLIRWLESRLGIAVGSG